MKITANMNIGVVLGIALAGIAFVLLRVKSERAHAEARPGVEGAPAGQTKSGAQSNGFSAVAPFIFAETATDSPSTNFASRLVKFTAEISGTPSAIRQWKVDKGDGFVNVSASATNATLWITNAQVSDSGLYALFATNSVGGTNTMPQPLIIIEGVD